MPLMFEHILVLGEICLAYFFVELVKQLKQNIDANVYHSSHNLLMLVYMSDSCGGKKTTGVLISCTAVLYNL